jgi:hypothetical protein
MSHKATLPGTSPIRTLSASELDAVAGGLAPKITKGCIVIPPTAPPPLKIPPTDAK